MAKLTVIVTAYNEEKYIVDCLRSLENQTFKDFDLIIVDDGSTDKTLDILNSYLKITDMNMKILTQENSGVSIARNNALKYVDSDFIKFLDGDDFLQKDALEKMVGMAIKFDLPIIKTSYKMVRGNHVTNNAYNANFDKAGTIIDLSKNKDWLVLENVGIGCKLFKSDCFNGIEFPTFEGDFVPEDLAIMPFIHAKAGMVGVSDLSFVNYRRHAGSLTNLKTRVLSSYYVDSLDSLEYLYKLFKDNGLYEEYKEQLAKMDVTYRVLDMLSFSTINGHHSISEKIKILDNLRKLAKVSLDEFGVDKELYKNENAIWWPLFMGLNKLILPNSKENIDVEKIKKETKSLLLNNTN